MIAWRGPGARALAHALAVVDGDAARWRGLCFEAATHALDVVEDAGVTFPVLVHGAPRGAGEIGGKRIGHAWVEVFDELVIDWTINVQHPLLRRDYYRIGDMQDCHVRRYTPREARGWLLREGHYGPWEAPITEALGA